VLTGAELGAEGREPEEPGAEPGAEGGGVLLGGAGGAGGAERHEHVE
jgi:hypothetical protein